MSILARGPPAKPIPKAESGDCDKTPILAQPLWTGDGAVLWCKCQSKVLKQLFSPSGCKSVYRTFRIRLQLFSGHFRTSGGPFGEGDSGSGGGSKPGGVEASREPLLKAITCIFASNKQDD